MSRSEVSAQNKKEIELTKHENDWLKAHPKIILGVDSTWDPVVRIGKDGELSGT
ncbi:hypothetical protein ACFLS7_00310 [Bacteroidota bacterium]